MYKEFIDKLEKDFYNRLEEKTSWGRNDLKKEFKESLQKCLIDLVDNEFLMVSPTCDSFLHSKDGSKERIK